MFEPTRRTTDSLDKFRGGVPAGGRMEGKRKGESAGRKREETPRFFKQIVATGKEDKLSSIIFAIYFILLQ